MTRINFEPYSFFKATSAFVPSAQRTSEPVVPPGRFGFSLK